MKYENKKKPRGRIFPAVFTYNKLAREAQQRLFASFLGTITYGIDCFHDFAFRQLCNFL